MGERDTVAAARSAWSSAFEGMPAPPPGAVRPAADSDFFQVGGTSLLALTVTAELAEELAEEVPVRLLLQNPRFGAFAAALHAYLEGPGADAPGRPRATEER